MSSCDSSRYSVRYLSIAIDGNIRSSHQMIIHLGRRPSLPPHSSIAPTIGPQFNATYTLFLLLQTT